MLLVLLLLFTHLRQEKNPTAEIDFVSKEGHERCFLNLYLTHQFRKPPGHCASLEGKLNRVDLELRVATIVREQVVAISSSFAWQIVFTVFSG